MILPRKRKLPVTRIECRTRLYFRNLKCIQVKLFYKQKIPWDQRGPLDINYTLLSAGLESSLEYCTVSLACVQLAENLSRPSSKESCSQKIPRRKWAKWGYSYEQNLAELWLRKECFFEMIHQMLIGSEKQLTKSSICESVVLISDICNEPVMPTQHKHLRSTF